MANVDLSYMRLCTTILCCVLFTISFGQSDGRSFCGTSDLEYFPENISESRDFIPSRSDYSIGLAFQIIYGKYNQTDLNLSLTVNQDYQGSSFVMSEMSSKHYVMDDIINFSEPNQTIELTINDLKGPHYIRVYAPDTNTTVSGYVTDSNLDTIISWSDLDFSTWKNQSNSSSVYIQFDTGAGDEDVGNISGQEINSMVDRLNLNSQFSGINFYIDTVNRVHNNEWTVGLDIGDQTYESVPALSINPTESLNLFSIIGFSHNLGLGGVGIFPWYLDLWDSVYYRATIKSFYYTDQAVVESRSHVADHEIGHALGLLHTFNYGCGSDQHGDYVDDTPVHAYANWGCETGTDSCPDDPGLDPVDNIMNYVYSPDCPMIPLTPGQGVRILWAINNWVPTLIDTMPKSTWSVIQDSIFTPNCISCHDHGLYFAEQSNLILAEDTAYQELINVVPNNEAAAEDGLTLVGTDGIVSLYNSFLWEKINAQDFEHFYDDHPEYGSLMPLGVDFLTNGQLEFIRQWIVAGAPDSGIVADINLLSDTSRFTLPDFEPLGVPENGIQLHLGPFEIAPQFERELFYFSEIDTSDLIYVNKVEITMSPGSHHFILYTYDEGLFEETLLQNFPESDVYRDLRNLSGEENISTLIYMPWMRFITGTQIRFFQYSFPEGVALRLDPFYGFDMNSHYVNYTDQTTYGEVYTNLHTINPSEVSHVAEILQLNNTEFSLAPMETTVVNVDYWIGDEFEGYDDLNVFQLQSHAHQKNLEFRIYKISESDPDYREMIYMALDWEHPPIINYDPPIVFNSDEGFELEATYYNNTEDTTKFGFLSTDEMMILFGLFYPNSELSSDKQISIPLQFNLNQNFPNPFNPFTTISYDLPIQTIVDLSIFDLSGRKLVTLVNRKQAPGKKSFTWNGLNDQGEEVGSGVYIYRVTTNQTTQSKKMLLIK